MIFPDWLEVYGDPEYRGSCPTESAEQITFFNVLRSKGFDTAIHIRNEGRRSYQQVSKQKAEGMVPGAADIIIPGCPAFVLELKRQDHTKSHWQPGQIEYLERCKKDGAFVALALGYKGALEALEAWSQSKSVKPVGRYQVS